MRLLTPIVPDRAAPLAAANPLAKLGAGLVLLVALFASLDGLTAAIVLAALVAALPFSGIGIRALAGRARLVLLAAIAIGLFNILFAAEQLGPPVVEIGSIRIGATTAVGGVGLALRLVAIALAGILATMTSDPTEVADALVQQLRVPPRFAIGVLAALRLAPGLAREWEILGLARRARGVDAGHSPLAAVRLLGGRLMALLVAAIRRGSRLALAMEARGFGSRGCRTVARPQRMRPADWAWIVGAVVVAGGAIAISVAVGTWRPLLG